MKEIALNSSALSACAYDPQSQYLCIRFRRSGECYLYETIPAAVVQALLVAESQGEYFNLVIRRQFSFRRLS